MEETEELTQEEEDEDAKIRDSMFGEEVSEHEIAKRKAEGTRGKKEDLHARNLSEAFKILANKGILPLNSEEIPEDENEIEQYLEDAVGQSIENRIEEIVTGYPDIVKNLVKFTHNGGDPHQFLQELAKNRAKGLTADMDLSERDNQILVVRNQLKAEGYDEDYIDTQIEFLEDSGKLYQAARTHFKRWEQQEQARQQQIVEQQRKAVREEKESRQKLKIELADIITEHEEIGGLRFSPEDKRTLPGYIMDRNVQLQNGEIVTPLRRDLYAVLQDGSKTLLLAKLLKSGLDLSVLEKQIKTKVASEVKEGIRRTKNLGAPKSSGGASKDKRLSDFF